MVFIIKALKKINFLRLVRNLLFWLVVTFNYFNNAEKFPYSRTTQVGLFVLCFFTLALLSYANNLWLLPNVLRKRLYKKYILGLSVLIFCGALLMLSNVYFIDKYFTDISYGSFTMLYIFPGNFYKELAKDQSVFFEAFFGAVLCTSVWLFINALAWFTGDYFVQQKRLDLAVNEKLQAQLDLIKNQVSPHFLFNNLNNLYGLSLIKSDILPESILASSNVLRYFIYETTHNLTRFVKEKEVMQSYINLELLRYINTQHFKFTIDADADYKIPPLLWLPILENIFKHGSKQTNSNAFINYSFIIKNSELEIRSSNSYKESYLRLESKKKNGLGLENFKKRLAIIYPNKHTLNETEDNGIYSIYVKINLYG
jgi:two-component system, LytTR family, sensor kinase